MENNNSITLALRDKIHQSINTLWSLLDTKCKGAINECYYIFKLVSVVSHTPTYLSHTSIYYLTMLLTHCNCVSIKCFQKKIDKIINYDKRNFGSNSYNNIKSLHLWELEWRDIMKLMNDRSSTMDNIDAPKEKRTIAYEDFYNSWL